MRILRIRMQDFGPYIDEDIDFAELNERRLFLLEGKTGCGKSTIIEGVVFALYGQDSKGRHEGVRRNSAPTKQNAIVTLEFEVGGVAYRVIRSPQMTDYDTGKKLKTHKVNLAEIDSDGNVIAGRTWDAIKEVGAEITSIIHLNQNQFTRIVVLPQGQFSKFLRSKPDEKQELLEAIFPIDDWKEIQKRIRKEAKDARDERGALLDAAKQVAHTTREYTNADSDTSDEKDAELLKTIDEVRAVQTEATSKITKWTANIESEEKGLAKRRKEADAQKKSLVDQEEMNEAITERVGLLEEKEQLDVLEKSITPMDEALAKHQDAERLKGILSSLVSAKTVVQKNGEAIDKHVDDTGMDADTKGKSAEDIKQLSETIATKVKTVNSIDTQENEKQKITDTLDVKQKALKEAHIHHSELRLEQHKAWATQIAQDSLKEGDPCLVCGSTEHPTPADGDVGESAELEAALTAVSEADDGFKKAKVQISTFSKSIQQLRTELKLSEGESLPDVASLKADRDAHQKLYELKHTGDTLGTTRDDRQAAWDASENQHNLDNMEKINAQILESDKKKEFTDAISQYTERRAINTNELEKQEIIDAEGRKSVEISKDIEDLEETMSVLFKDEQAHVILKVCLSNLDSSHSTLSSSIDDYTQFAAGMADLQWVDDRLRGIRGEKMKMDIIAWLLRRWFEAALANANARLAEIGSGRYSLEMIQVGKEEMRTGLNIGVVDALSDSLKARSTTSLSGGESFYISLALALGMSDVVSEEAGGIHLGTLFIDEGFGTLDQETLDDVMGVIDEIGKNNRVIGLISHVESLKQRITSQITVTKKGDGTSTIDVQA